MTLADIYHYAGQHYDHHRRQLTLATLARRRTGRTATARLAARVALGRFAAVAVVVGGRRGHEGEWLLDRRRRRRSFSAASIH
jgi:hypothetical protein